MKCNDAEPFLLRPAAKGYLWGGSRLNDDFSKGINMEPLAETWECSTHPDGTSMVASGRFEGCLLTEVLAEHPEYMGTHPAAHAGAGADKESGGKAGAPTLPVLIKLIDAKQDLSVQVHPDDAYAREHENGQLGKTELWYVVDAAKDAEVVYGFWRDMEKEELRRILEAGSLEKYLRRIPVRKNDVFYIEAGTVHAIGAGTLIAEIQENSNLTYRLYDYNRVDRQGNRRPLHIEKALDVADLSCAAKPRQPMRVLKFMTGYATELLARCAYFQVERMLVNTESRRGMAGFRTDSSSFQVFLCLDGCGAFYWNGGGMLDFYRGDCIFVPADSVAFKIHGKAQFLKVKC